MERPIQILMHVGTKISSHFSDMLVADFGLGLNEWRIVSMLANVQKCTIGDIVTSTGIHKTIVSRSLQQLSTRSLLAVERRKRYVTVRALDDCVKLYARVLPAVRAREADLMRLLSDGQQQALAAALTCVQLGLEALDSSDRNSTAAWAQS